MENDENISDINAFVNQSLDKLPEDNGISLLMIRSGSYYSFW